MTSLREEGIRVLAQHLRNCRCLTSDPHALQALNDCIRDLNKRAGELHTAYEQSSQTHTEQE